MGEQREGTLNTLRAPRSRQGGHAEKARLPGGGGEGKGDRTNPGDLGSLLRSQGTSKEVDTSEAGRSEFSLQLQVQDR